MKIHALLVFFLHKPASQDAAAKFNSEEKLLLLAYLPEALVQELCSSSAAAATALAFVRMEGGQSTVQAAARAEAGGAAGRTWQLPAATVSAEDFPKKWFFFRQKDVFFK